VARALQSQISEAVVVDASMGMLRQAQRVSKLNVTCSQSESLPFPAGYFERVIMVDALHHVIDQHRSASETWRVVKPGGLVVILEPDIRRIPVKIVAILEKMLLMRSHFISPADIAQFFSFPNAVVRIFEDGFNAWVCVRKN
jgi:demethylmenaquinone methyltransferase/2-methoxy-6-polyprenyl-1,4-benzoquinol methylase